MIAEEEAIEQTLGPLTLDQIEDQVESLSHEVGLWLEISDLLRSMRRERKRGKPPVG